MPDMKEQVEQENRARNDSELAETRDVLAGRGDLVPPAEADDKLAFFRAAEADLIGQVNGYRARYEVLEALGKLDGMRAIESQTRLTLDTLKIVREKVKALEVMVGAGADKSESVAS